MKQHIPSVERGADESRGRRDDADSGEPEYKGSVSFYGGHRPDPNKGFRFTGGRERGPGCVHSLDPARGERAPLRRSLGQVRKGGREWRIGRRVGHIRRRPDDGARSDGGKTIQ